MISLRGLEEAGVLQSNFQLSLTAKPGKNTNLKNNLKKLYFRLYLKCIDKY